MPFRWTENDLDNSLFEELSKNTPSEAKIRQLIEDGANVNKIDCLGDTVIGEAISNLDRGLDIKFIRLLIDLGADINLLTYGVNSLFHAVHKYRIDIFKLLLEAGADPNCIIDDDACSILDMVIDEEWSCDDFEDEKIMTEIKALLISYGAKQARDLYADIPERYILISTNNPTGMLTYKKNIKPENILNINENLVNEFKSWILQKPEDWKLPKEIYKEYYERGFKIAERIKKTVGLNIEIKVYYLTCEVWEEYQHGKYEWKTIL